MLTPVCDQLTVKHTCTRTQALVFAISVIVAVVPEGLLVRGERSGPWAGGDLQEGRRN